MRLMIGRKFRLYIGLCFVLALVGLKLSASPTAQAPQDSFRAAVAQAVKLSTLAELGAQPFHLKLTAQDNTMHNPEYSAEIEVWWAAPEQWRRTISSPMFTQTAIQNGSRYYESNSATDYLPFWLDELMQASIDSIPVAALANVSPDEYELGCGKWQGSGGYASVCFGPDGTASHIFDEPFAITFAHYQEFGDKKIATEIHVWPGDRSEVVAKVTELEPLEKWQPSKTDTPISNLFDASEDIGFSSRLRFVAVPESALVPADTPARQPLTWPSSFVFPLDGTIAVTVHIDRGGNIREFPAAISKNQGINGGAVAQIKNWKFKPYVVDGSPVQVVTTLVVPFHLKYEPLGANGKHFPEISFGQHMEASRALSDLRAAGSSPFHLHASFTLGTNPPGTYEETWQSPDDWTRQVALGGAALHQTRSGGNTATNFDGDTRWQPQMLAVVSLMQDRLPDPNTFQEADWGNSAVPASNVFPNNGLDASEPVLIRAARGQVDANNHPTSGQAYWFDSDGLLRASFEDGVTVVNSDFAPWNLKQVPRRFELFLGNAAAGIITVDSIETPTDSRPAPYAGLRGRHVERLRGVAD